MTQTQDPRTEAAHDTLGAIRANVEHNLQGKPEAIGLALVAILAGGHLLIEDVPGVGKTMLAKSLAESLGCTWRRVQFTPDLLPTDLVGVNIYDSSAKEFRFHPGPVFANLLLADEVNRASPKTQSALLEAMEEEQVSVDGRTYRLSSPFMVLATQNPFEHEGTYPLPESQLDRFLLRITMGYPGRDAALRMLELHADASRDRSEALPSVTTPDELRDLVKVTDEVYVAPAVREYVLDIVEATRNATDVALGVSPRGSLHLLRASRAAAVLAGRNYVVPDDVKWLAHPVLSHRIALTPEAEVRGASAASVLDAVLASVPVPIRR